MWTSAYEPQRMDHHKQHSSDDEGIYQCREIKGEISSGRKLNNPFWGVARLGEASQ